MLSFGYLLIKILKNSKIDIGQIIQVIHMKINFKGSNNLYEQIVQELIKYINLGIYKESDKLPSCRSLALELGVNPNTIEKAYSILETEGYIDIIPKKGAYVKSIKDPLQIRKDVAKEIIKLKNLGVSMEEIISVVKEVYSND